MTDNLDALSAAASPSQFLTRDQRAVADAMHEGIPGFEDALASGVAFMNYISLWSGGGAVPVSALDQQERLGIAKSFAVATDHLDAAVREAVAKEREACAGECDAAEREHGHTPFGWQMHMLAKTIRARKDLPND